MILFILQQCGWCSFVLIYGGVDGGMGVGGGGGGGVGLYFYLSLILLISLKKHSIFNPGLSRK